MARITVTAAPNHERWLPDARMALALYFRRKGSDDAPFAAARWKFRLTHIVRKCESTDYHFDVAPIDGRMLSDGRGHSIATYRVPANAFKMIDFNDPSFVYRGMSWEEWAYVRKHCHVRTKGSRNGDDFGYTFFGDAAMAHSYAMREELAFQPTKNRPGVIIAILRADALPQAVNPKRIPYDEFAVIGALPAQMIRRVWYVKPTKIGQRRLIVSSSRYGGVDGDEQDKYSGDYVTMPADDAPLRRVCAHAAIPNRRR